MQCPFSIKEFVVGRLGFLLGIDARPLLGKLDTPFVWKTVPALTDDLRMLLLISHLATANRWTLVSIFYTNRFSFNTPFQGEEWNFTLKNCVLITLAFWKCFYKVALYNYLVFHGKMVRDGVPYAKEFYTTARVRNNLDKDLHKKFTAGQETIGAATSLLSSKPLWRSLPSISVERDTRYAIDSKTLFLLLSKVISLFQCLLLFLRTFWKASNPFRYREEPQIHLLCTQLLQPHKLKSYLYFLPPSRPAVLFWRSGSLPILTTRKRNCCAACARTSRPRSLSAFSTAPCWMPGRYRGCWVQVVKLRN